MSDIVFAQPPEVFVEGVWWDLTDMTRGRQYGSVYKVSPPGSGEKVFLFSFSWIVENCREVHGGRKNVPEVIVRIEDQLVPIDVVPGDVVVVVHLGDPDPRAGRADVVFAIPTDVGASLHRHVTGRQVIHKLSARSELLPFTEFTEELHILLVGDGEATGAAACRPHHLLWYIVSLHCVVVLY